MNTLRKSNPWLALGKEQPFVLDGDLEAIRTINSKHSGRETEIRLDVMPEPFVGNPEAPIWLLNLNPGFDEGDLTHGDDIREQQRTALTLEADHFWLLNPKNDHIPGYHWWTKRTRKLAEEVGLRNVTTGLFCVELFPYHSQSFLPGAKVPSQDFTFEVVRSGVRKKKTFLVMRSEKVWRQAVPELGDADLIRTNTPRCAYLTPGNISRFNEVVAKLEKQGI